MTSDLVLQGHDWVVLGGVDVQDVVVVLPTQVVGDVGEGGAGRLGNAVVDDDHVVFAIRWRRARVPVPQAVLRVPLLDLSHLMSGNRSFWWNDEKDAVFKKRFSAKVRLHRINGNKY